MPPRNTFRKQQARSLAAQREKVREEEAPHGGQHIAQFR